ncbi:hypothetical protein [Jatrophihabitans sp.]|uniref:hypothetical protein n=1 Tax=Jatrophihabitans sp. TaxID=1932789 RepID=UPI0030C6CC64|nr:hypothetical protein [Jatrophihabitans sp.]
MSPASASGVGWSVQQTHLANPVPNGQLAAVSCSSAAHCVAVGQYSGASGYLRPLSEIWDGTAWRTLPTPIPKGSMDGYLSGVSCVSAVWCMAVGHYQNSAGVSRVLAQRWNGTSWTASTVHNAATSADQLTGVSCHTATFCAAVGTVGIGSTSRAVIESWNGTRWKLDTTPAVHGATLTGVSCPAATRCVAVGTANPGTSTAAALAEFWSAAGWSVTPVPTPASSTSLLTGVSCTAVARCMAVGSVTTGATVQASSQLWNGGSWSSAGPTGLGLHQFDAVSCFPGGSCFAVGMGIYPTIWDARDGWRVVKGVAAWASGISCVSITDCVSVDGQGTSPGVTVWNGSVWRYVTTPNPLGADPRGVPAFTAISCATSTVCVALGTATGSNASVGLTGSIDGGAFAESWRDGVWTVDPLPPSVNALDYGATPFNTLGGISCPRTNWCLAVATNQTGGPLTLLWNGVSWSLGAAPVATGRFPAGAVSCVSPTFCMTVGSSSLVFRHRTMAQVWDGSTWHLLSTAEAAGTLTSALASVSCSSTTSCTAVGEYHLDSNRIRALAEHWNGTSWSVSSTPAAPIGDSDALTAVSCAPGHALCVAIGTSTSRAKSLLEMTNGTRWKVSGASIPASDPLTAVACPSAALCIAVAANGARESLDSGDWLWNPTPAPGHSDLTSLSCAPGYCAAAGSVRRPAQVPLVVGTTT